MAERYDGSDGVVATVVIDTYPGAPEGMRHRRLLEKSAADFVELAAALGFRASRCDLSGVGEERGTRRAVIEGFAGLARHPAMRKIVYWTGHGKTLGRNEEEFFLIPRDGHRDGAAQPELSFNVTEVAHMASRLSGEVLLILDACFSATALDKVTRIVRGMGREVDERGKPAGFAVVATAEAEAGSGDWVRCLQQVMGNRLFRQSNEDKPLFLRTERYLGVRDLLEALSAKMGWTRGLQVQDWQEIHPLSRTFLTNPYFSESARRAVRPEGDESWIGDELRKDVMRPFSGTPDLWGIRDFTGRTASVRRMVTWLGTRSRGMFVVTGPSGSGKSALLSYVAHLTIPEFYERLRIKLPLYLQPDLHSIHAAVHCRGKTISGLVKELAARLRPLGLEADNPFATPEEFTAAVARMAEMKGALTLLVDGLDEAATGQSFEIARDLLNRLAARPAIKVVVGTRYLPRQLPAGYEVTETLLEVLQTSEEPLAIDEDPGTDADIHRYVDQVLGSEGSPYRTADEERTYACASLTTRSHGLFIVASMWAHHLARQPAPLPRGRLDSDIGSGLAELDALMAEEVRRLDPVDPQRTQDLLRPLALAQGAGLPCTSLWLEIANALRVGNRAAYTHEDLLRVVRGTVRTLVSVEHEDGRDLYRLHHLSFGAHLLPRENVQPELHRRIVHVLDRIRRSDGNGSWERADSYIKNQIAAHAAAAGDDVLEGLTSDLGFLVNADPAGVLPLVGNASQAPESLQLYLRVVARFPRLEARERWALTRATALRSHPDLLQEMGHDVSRLPWNDVWTDVSPEPVYRTWVGPFGGAHSVTWTGGGGNLVLASGTSEVRAWHASSGHVAWTFERWADASSGGGAAGAEGPLSAVGVIDDDIPVVVAADARALLLWTTAFPRRPQRMFWGGDVKSVNVTSLGADAYAAALEGDMLWVWHWPLKAPPQPRRIHHVRLSEPARALRLVPLADALVAVIGGRERLELRDVTRGTRNRDPLGSLPTGTVVDDIAVLSEPGGAAWIAAVGWQRLRVWRLRTIPFEENLLPVLDIVTSGRGVALGRGHGGVLAAVKNGTEIRTWQMDGTEHIPLTRHDTMLKSIAYDPSGSGRLVAADGGSVRIWEPVDATPQRAAARSALHLLRLFPGPRDRHLLCRAEGPRVRISEHTTTGRSRRWSSEEVILDHTPDKVLEISAVPLTDDTWLIATVFRRTVRVWTVVNGEVAHRHEISLDGPRDDGIRAIALHADSDMVRLFVPVHQRLRTYRLDAAENVWRPAESTASVTGAAMIEQIAVVACPGDAEPYLVARAGASAYLWHGGPHPISRIDVPIGPISALGCGRSSARPPLVAVGADSGIFLSEFEDGRRQAELLARSTRAVRSLALIGSAERPLLVTGTGPATVRLWDLVRRRPLLDIPDRGYLMEQVAAVSDHRGVTLFLAGKDRCDQLYLPAARIDALLQAENGGAARAR